MILFWMFFIFKVEVLQVPGGFKAWFQQSFCTFESSLMLLVVWMPWCLLRSLPRCCSVYPKMCWCVEMPYVSIYKSLGVSERHVAKSVWWHVSQSDWRSFKDLSPRHMASFDWLKCLNFRGATCQHQRQWHLNPLTLKKYNII